MPSRRQVLLAGCGAVGALALGGCRGKKADVVIGSKNFQEQWILAALIAGMVGERAGVSTATKDFGGTMLAHKALTSGNIDGYVEYTGTALTAVLDQPPSRDTDAVYRQVADAYRDRFELTWLPPLGFENTFAILVRKRDAERHHLASISDLAAVAGDMRPGFGFEFYDRPDGYRGLVDTYGIDFGKPPKQMKLGLTYRALDAGEVDVIAGNSTDGQIEALDLVMLRDDKAFFPPYQAAPVMRTATLERRPEVGAAVRALAGKIDAATMRRANYAVDGENKSPETAARELAASIGVG